MPAPRRDTTDAALQRRCEGLQRQLARQSSRVRDAQRQSRMLADLVQAVSAANAAEWSSTEVMQFAVDRVCAFAGWPVGHVYLIADDGSELVPSGIWHLDDPKRFATFREVTEATRFPPGVGLPGRVLAGGEPAWIEDVIRDGNFPRAKLADELGVRGAFGFPVVVGGKVAAVMEFFSSACEQRDELILSTVDTVGHQIGRALEREAVTRELRRARDDARTAERAKSAFLASMSHEIRTPMNAILGMSSLLLDTELEGRQQEFARTIRSSADALLAIINDILDFSKIEAGKMRLETAAFNLLDCVESSLDLVAHQAANKQIELLCEFSPGTPEGIASDMTRVRQVIVNLLSNAVKFTDAGEVVVRVDADPADGDGMVGIHVAVQDTGIGIAPERRDLLFRSFSQLDDSTTRRYGGTGLGLAISRRLAELLGGSLECDSSGVPGEGATFHFRFRAPTAEVPRSVPAPARAHPLAGKCALVVDDNATNRRILQLELARWRMAVVPVESAALALAEFAQGSFDIVLLDMQMPEMDGLMLARELRRRGESGRIVPLVMLSSLGQDEIGADALDFAARLTKPVKQSRLFSTLVEILAPDVEVWKPHMDGEFVENCGRDHPLRILLAEDSRVNQQVALHVLGRLGYSADVCANGLEAVDAVRRGSYDVVLMDIEMPELDGLGATRRIRQECDAGRQPHIIAMTADAARTDRAACLSAGMNAYLCKPVAVRDLAAALTSAPRLAADPFATLPEPRADGFGARLRDLFAAELADNLDLLQRGLDALAQGRDQDRDTLRRAAHTIKGSAVAVAADKIGAAAERLEQGLAGGEDGTDPSVDDLRRLLADLRAAADDEAR